MAKLARDIMTIDPACCSLNTTLDEVATMMVQHKCGEIPVIDSNHRVVGVITDRDIVCRAIANGKSPIGMTVESCMSQPVVTIREDASLENVIATMEKHQIRRLPVVMEGGWCAGIIAQADLARMAPEHEVAELVRDVSQETGRPSH